MTGIDRLEWFVLLPRTGLSGEDSFFNIFNSNRFRGSLMDLKARAKKDGSVSIEDGVQQALRYSFWAKTEYEIEVKALFANHSHKIDVYTQVMLHFPQFYKYLRDNWNHIPSKSYKQQAKED